MRKGWLAAGALALVIAGGVVWWATTRDKPADGPRERVYRAETACLLTSDKGLADADAAKAWDGLQQASAATSIKVQYLQVAGPQTVENAQTFVAGQAQGGCDVILAVGDLPGQAVEASSAKFPKQAFVVIGGKKSESNLSYVDNDPAVIKSMLVAKFKHQD